MENKNVIAGVALLFAVMLTLGCVGQGPATEESPGEGEEVIDETGEQDTAETPEDTSETSDQEETGLEGASSLEFKAKQVGEEGEGDWIRTLHFRAKNLGQDNTMLRVDEYQPGKAYNNYTDILLQGEEDGWERTNEQMYITYSDITESHFTNKWDKWYDSAFKQRLNMLSREWESGNYTYTSGAGYEVTFYDVEVDQDIPDSVFQPDPENIAQPE